MQFILQILYVYFVAYYDALYKNIMKQGSEHLTFDFMGHLYA